MWYFAKYQISLDKLQPTDAKKNSLVETLVVDSLYKFLKKSFETTDPISY